MTTVPYAMPKTLGVKSVQDTCLELHGLPLADAYELEFSSTQHFEPFGMLLLASAIWRLKERKTPNLDNVLVTISRKSCENVQEHDFARRLGFRWSIGFESNLPSVKTTPTRATIPITRLLFAEMFKDAGGRDPIQAELVKSAAGNIATTLCVGAAESEQWIVLRYCFHELIRNTFEHGQIDSVWCAGTTRHTQDDIQIAIVDGGRGIRASLATNPRYRLTTDLEAIQTAMRPGVSRNSCKIQSDEEVEKLLENFPGQDPFLYNNSGYGQTITGNLGKSCGHLGIVSGGTSIAYVSGSEHRSVTHYQGTAVRLVLHPSKLERGLGGCVAANPTGRRASQGPPL